MGHFDKWEYGEHVFRIESNEELYSDTDETEYNNLVVDGDTVRLFLYKKRYELKCNNAEVDELKAGDIISVRENGYYDVLYRNEEKEIDIFMTNKCNSNCVMCPLSIEVRRRDNGDNAEWLMEYIAALPEDIAFINVTGGEPTFDIKTFLYVMEKLRDRFCYSDFQLLTNGRSFADGEFLKKVLDVCPSKMRFTIPLHSSDVEIHDRITSAKGSFRQTDAGIRNLLRACEFVEIRIVLSKQNIDMIPETIDYIINTYTGSFCVTFVAMEMMGNAAVNLKDLWLDYDVLFERIRASIQRLIRAGIDVQLYNFPLCAISRGYWQIAAKSITGHKIRYMDACDGCDVKDMCGGFFYSTKQLVEPRVIPVRGYR